MKKVQGYVDVGLAFFVENYKWIITPVVVVALVAAGLYFSGVFGGDSISAEGPDAKPAVVEKSDPASPVTAPGQQRVRPPVAVVGSPTPVPAPPAAAAEEPPAAQSVNKVPEYKVLDTDNVDAELDAQLDNNPAEPSIPPRQVRIPIRLQGALDLGSLEFELLYEPKTLEFVAAEAGELASNSLVQAQTRAPGRLWLAIVNPHGINGDGNVAHVTFQMREGGQADSPLILEQVESHQASTLTASWPQTTHGIYDLDDSSYVSPLLAYPASQ